MPSALACAEVSSPADGAAGDRVRGRGCGLGRGSRDPSRVMERVSFLSGSD